MHDALPEVGARQPPIALRRSDHQALLAIAYGALLKDTRSAGSLLEEVCRAELMSDDAVTTTVALWSRVLFVDGRSDTPQMITLVPPEAASSAEGRASVLSPVGAALIGLSKGQHIRRPDRHGGELSLTVVDIFPPDHTPGERE